ncbi:hypothetical protein PVL29_012287 [Vitis rotundifolia]|uniref:Uncharacterized protein n=1 Tax=Vitis rotundifolia TaxID=103349 RepID=A0AA39DRY1_VITRO|nr:hypothetical protein PVL29_012287 [Vitis rotundifolia]
MTPDMTVKLLMDAAEKDFKSDRLEEALVLANVANQIDPKFEGIIAPCLAAKSNGEIDWNGVLGIVDADPDIDAILNRYEELVDLLHPDGKKGSVAAEGALRLVSEACWKLLLSQSSLRKSGQKSPSDQTRVRRHPRGVRGSKKTTVLPPAPTASSDFLKKSDVRVRVRVRHPRGVTTK